jgi:hypothetical protein
MNMEQDGQYYIVFPYKEAIISWLEAKAERLNGMFVHKNKLNRIICYQILDYL